jgi:hypothetical protein
MTTTAAIGWTNPPARYDHPFKGPVEILWLSPTDTVKVCHTWTACVFSNHPKVCRIYINSGARGNWTEQSLIRHEMGHCNGWPGNHPD